MKPTAPDCFWHLTLNTGHTRKSYRHEVSDQALDSMRTRGLFAPQAELPIPGMYKVKTTIDRGGARIHHI
jgi:hypothetical protein